MEHGAPVAVPAVTVSLSAIAETVVITVQEYVKVAASSAITVREICVLNVICVSVV